MFGASLMCSLDLIRETRASAGLNNADIQQLTVPVIGEVWGNAEVPWAWYEVFPDEGVVRQFGARRYSWARATVRALEQLRAILADNTQLHVNLATPVFPSGGGGTTPLDLNGVLNGSSSPQNAKATAVFIDTATLGKVQLPNLTILVPNGVATTPSTHAQHVIEVFGNEVGTSLQNIHLVFSPVVVPLNVAATAALTIFRSNSVVELLTAVDLVANYTPPTTPLVVNISQGTHSGPHDGRSALDVNVSNLVNIQHTRFVVAAAGNYGDSGVHSHLRPAQSVPAAAKLVVGSGSPAELFVEFWWDSSLGSIDIDARITTNAAAPQLAIAAGVGPTTVMSSTGGVHYGFVQASNQHGTLSSICFGLVEMNAQPLSNITVKFTVRSVSGSAVDVHAWLIGTNDQSNAVFVQSSDDATITSPASANTVIAVGAQDHAREVLVSSSRGFGGSAPCWLAAAPLAPALVVNGGNSNGVDLSTSFAAPRAAARLVVHGLTKGFATTKPDAICDILGVQRAPLPGWDRVVGHGQGP